MNDQDYSAQSTTKVLRRIRTDNGMFNLTDFLMVIGAMLLYAAVARIWQPTYMVKSAFKIFGFVILPILVSMFVRNNFAWLKIRLLDREAVKFFLRLLALCIGFLIMITLFARPIGDFFGVESIMAEIMTRTDSPKILVWGAVLYIPIVNAAAEEIFFRGFILQRLAMRFGFIPASLISAGFFAVYHLIVFRNWFNPLLLVLALSGLVLAGLILNWLAWHCRSLLTSWTVHGLMNIAVFIVAYPYFK